MDATAADVTAALARWRDVTAPLDHARVEKDAKLIASSLQSLLAARPERPAPAVDASKDAVVRAWSHSDFMARVATFGVATWFAKPPCLSALAVARLGWVNTECDLVQCRHCDAVVCCAIDATLSDRGAAAVATRFAKQLETAHDAACPWSHNPSPMAFTMLPLLGPSQVADTLWERVEKLFSVRSSVQDALKEMAVDAQAVAQLLEAASLEDHKALVETVKTRRGEKDPIDERVVLHGLIMSACGWSIQPPETDAVPVIVSCAYCNRHVPLTSTEEGTEEEAKQESDEGERPAKRQRITTSSMNPITSHRWFCPWVVPQRQDDERVRETIALVCDHTKDEASLAEFVTLPGWKQSAKALVHLDGSTKAHPTPSKLSPLAALATVQSVLALPDAY